MILTLYEPFCPGQMVALFTYSTLCGINSAEFIKVFMKSATAKALDSTYNQMQWAEGGHARLFRRKGTDLWIDMVCRLVLFLCIESMATGPCSQHIGDIEKYN